ncbi:MAG: hypothetical protein AABX47_04920, partial [Nanoarchaeota archaeon]
YTTGDRASRSTPVGKPILTVKNHQKYAHEQLQYKEATDIWRKTLSVIGDDLAKLMRGASSPFFVFENESDKDYMGSISTKALLESVFQK